MTSAVDVFAEAVHYYAQTLTLVLLRGFQKHIFLRGGGVVATPPLIFYSEPPYTPVYGTNG